MQPPRTENKLYLLDYVLFGKDRQARRYSGVALSVIDLSVQIYLNDELENLWVRIKGQATVNDTVVGMYY